MLDTAKNIMHTVGGGTADLARRVGTGSADIARRVGTETAVIARRVGSETADIARKVGPKRAIIGALVLGAAIGGTIYLVRYLRSRQDILDEEGFGTDEVAGTATAAGNQGKKRGRRRVARGTQTATP